LLEVVLHDPGDHDGAGKGKMILSRGVVESLPVQLEHPFVIVTPELRSRHFSVTERICDLHTDLCVAASRGLATSQQLHLAELFVLRTCRAQGAG
jgi:hypothetical protein